MGCDNCDSVASQKVFAFQIIVDMSISLEKGWIVDTGKTRPVNDISLDPSNWGEFREIAHQMMDDMIDHMQTIREWLV